MMLEMQIAVTKKQATQMLVNARNRAATKFKRALKSGNDERIAHALRELRVAEDNIDAARFI